MKSWSRFDLGLISKYRTELMGFSTIGILMCHAVGNNVLLPGPIHSLFSLGQLGVSIFFLLSGLGMYYSLMNKKQNGGKLGTWYLKRYLRILIPYSILIWLGYGWELFHGERSIGELLLNYSTIGYWIGNGGVWFVCFLIPLYLLIPWWDKFLSKCKFKIIPTIIIVFLMIFVGKKLGGYYNAAFNQGLFFFIGYWIAPSVKESKKINWVVVAILTGILFLIYHYVPFMKSLVWTWILLPIVIMIACKLLEFKCFKWLKPILAFLGAISLESYLSNTILGGITQSLNWQIAGVDLSVGWYIPYTSVVVFGILLAWGVNKLSKKIISSINL